jgi:hypothetical protein
MTSATRFSAEANGEVSTLRRIAPHAKKPATLTRTYYKVKQDLKRQPNLPFLIANTALTYPLMSAQEAPDPKPRKENMAHPSRFLCAT